VFQDKFLKRNQIVIGCKLLVFSWFGLMFQSVLEVR